MASKPQLIWPTEEKQRLMAMALALGGKLDVVTQIGSSMHLVEQWRWTYGPHASDWKFETAQAAFDSLYRYVSTHHIMSTHYPEK